MRCDIIIPVWNQFEATRDCIDSILKNTTISYKLIIIDNGSDRDTADFLKKLTEEKKLDILLIRNDTNLGFVKAVNQGITNSDAPYICVMNNDTIATRGWLCEMVGVMEAHAEIGLLNPSSNTSGQFPADGESIDNYASTLKKFKGQTQELYSCRGFCVLLKRKVIDTIGLLDEIYGRGYFEEADYSRKAQKKGFGVARAKGAYVYHQESISFAEMDDTKKLFERNERIFFKRWGKPVRVAYFIDRINSKDRIDDIAKSVVRNGHQILIFLKKGLDWPIGLDHFDIRRFDLNPVFFGLIAIYKILKRKRKKKIDIVLTDNPLFSKFLKMMERVFDTSVVIKPDKDKLFDLIENKSREF